VLNDEFRITKSRIAAVAGPRRPAPAQHIGTPADSRDLHDSEPAGRFSLNRRKRVRIPEIPAWNHTLFTDVSKAVFSAPFARRERREVPGAGLSLYWFKETVTRRIADG
jgi:hypothetical protein